MCYIAAPFTHPISYLKICGERSSPKVTCTYVAPHRFTAWVLLGGTFTPTRATMVADMAAVHPSISQEERLPLLLVNLATGGSEYYGEGGLTTGQRAWGGKS